MANPTYLVKLNNTDITDYLVAPNGYKVAPNKLWTDAGRDMSGNLHATLLGRYPKLTLSFRSLLESELSALCALLDVATIVVAFWDTKSSSYKSGNYYAGDYEHAIQHLSFARYEPFAVSLIPYTSIS